MPDSSPTDPAPENGRRRSRATVAESPKAHRRPPTDETDLPVRRSPPSAKSAVEDFRGEAPTATQRGWKSRWPTFATLAIAVLALATAALALFHPLHGGSPTFTAQETADAKKNVCTASTIARQAVVINTHLVNPRGGDQIGTLAVAANARLALLGGGAYLRERLDAEPATPADLAKAVKAMARTIDQMGINYLAGATSVVQQPLRSDLDKEITAITKLCA
jgi:hypothetical protein